MPPCRLTPVFWKVTLVPEILINTVDDDGVLTTMEFACRN
jgi:hypothetical protein